MFTFFPQKISKSVCIIGICYISHLFVNNFSLQLRFGMVDKYLSNTNVFEHSGRFYVTAENHIPQEINIKTLETLGKWDVDGTWTRPFSSHAKVYFALDSLS